VRREISGRGETDGLNVVVRVTCDSRVPTQLPVLYAKVPIPGSPLCLFTEMGAKFRTFAPTWVQRSETSHPLGAKFRTFTPTFAPGRDASARRTHE